MFTQRSIVHKKKYAYSIRLVCIHPNSVFSYVTDIHGIVCILYATVHKLTGICMLCEFLR